MKLRGYQRYAITHTIRHLLESDRVLLVMGTGGGKTVVAANICKSFEPILWIAHTKELLRQGKNCLVANKIDHTVLSASATRLPDKKYGLVVIDEYHHEACATYRNLLSKLNYKKLLGITATKDRLDRIGITFDRVFHSENVRSLIDSGFLSKLRLYRVRTEGNHIDELVAWVNRHRDYVGPTIFFVKSLKDAEYVSTRLLVTNEVVRATSNREAQLESFRDGSVQCLISCLILTEGVDLPMCRTAVIGRLTNSATLLAQMVGRPVRLDDNKTFCNIVEPAFMFRFDRHISTERIIVPDEKYISTPNGISGYTNKRCKT